MTIEHLLHDINNIMFSIIIDTDLLQQAILHFKEKNQYKVIFHKLNDIEKNLKRMRKMMMLYGYKN